MHGEITAYYMKFLLEARVCATGGHCVKITKRYSKIFILSVFFPRKILCFPSICNILEIGEWSGKDLKINNIIRIMLYFKELKEEY